MDNMVAQSYRSNQFRPPSPMSRPIQNKSSDEPPLLKRHKVEFTPDEPITHLAAGQNQVIIATKDKKILAIDTRSSKETQYDIARYLGNRLAQAKVHKIFLDPTGKFTLISLAYAADNLPLENLLYVKQVQPLPRLKNHLISAIAWNYPKTSTNNTGSNSTGTILLGTTRGIVLQTEFIHNDETKFFPLTPGPRQYVKEVFDVGPESGGITGLEYHEISNSSQTEKSFVILVCTNNRLYRMFGSVPANVDPPQLHLIFAQNSTNYKEVPGRLSQSKLDLYYPPSPTNSPPIRFAWLTEPGVMTSEIFNQYVACKSSFESNDDINLIPYSNPEDQSSLAMPSSTPSGMSPPFSAMSIYYYDKPISIVVTNFHIIILFRHCIRAICILNNLTIYEEYFSSSFGSAQGMSKDLVKNIIWVYGKRGVLRYRVSNENKNVWRIFLEQKRFDLAKKYSMGDEASYDRVISEEAQYYFRNKDYEKSAEIFARSKKSFEDVSLMFMEAKSSKALKKYLMFRLREFDDNQEFQIVLILAWLLELIVSSSGPSSDTDTNADQPLGVINEDLEELLSTRRVVDCLRNYSKFFYGIIENYHNWPILERIATLIKDHKSLVRCHMSRAEYGKALEIIRLNKSDELLYYYGPILMQKMPRELVDALIERPNIKASRLIPILIQENPYYSKCSETIRYLEHCVNVLKSDRAILHNYLFELYARYRDEKTLLAYLEDEIASMDETRQQVCYLDLKRCIALCSELKLNETHVILYSLMGELEKAVDLALELDMEELAKSVAKRVESDDDQRRLWLSIAKSALSKNADIQVATRLLRECKLLKIEDILPFFPDYTTIDYFKDAIRQSLQEYKNQILALKDGTYDNIADEIRNEIKAFRSRYSIIKLGQRCELCLGNIMMRMFYVFPCGHLFHEDCIRRETLAIADSAYLETNSLECVYCGGLLAATINRPAPIETHR